MSADSLMDKYGDQQGWNDESKLGICLSYINAQQSDDAFEDHLKEYVATETDEDEDECSCGNKLRSFMHNCPNSSNHDENYGCPECDDHCGFCK